MTPDTAELAVADGAAELVDGRPLAGPAPRAGERALPARSRGRRRTLCVPRASSLDPARAQAVRECWRALWTSRLLIWVAGVGTLLTYGFGPARHAFNPPGITRGFGWLGDLLAAPAARWDAAWYGVIAHYGYRPDLGTFTSSRDAFFPLYPLGLRAFAAVGVPLVLGGVLFSLIALALALYGIHRLTTLELARTGGRSLLGTVAPGADDSRARRARADVARLAVMVTALSPMAFYFSAVYSESLYLALSVGLFYAARTGRFAVVGLLGALAGATRSAGIVLLLPAVMLYLYGPREDRAPDFPRARGLAVRYRPRKDLLWLALAPLGLALYVAYLGLSGGDPLSPFHAQDVWGRHFAGPYLGVWDGLRAGFGGLRQLLSLQQSHLYYPIDGKSAFINSEHNLLLLAFLAAGVVAIVGVLRRLPLAYGVYVIAALALPLSYPVTAQPLMSLPRFLIVLFPLSMWLGAWLAGHPRAQRPALLVSGLLLAFFVAQFATWHWVS
ncbi:MAG TPA: mannosyltransferase family protein [Solirubrobacteraceae bacterium]|jgi:hypothetical protein|nr:mannosyltransferase family protein [Solirubrobacteraceae bacterium]